MTLLDEIIIRVELTPCVKSLLEVVQIDAEFRTTASIAKKLAVTKVISDGSLGRCIEALVDDLTSHLETLDKKLEELRSHLDDEQNQTQD